jgi:hypothetical protein
MSSLEWRTGTDRAAQTLIVYLALRRRLPCENVGSRDRDFEEEVGYGTGGKARGGVAE